MQPDSRTQYIELSRIPVCREPISVLYACFLTHEFDSVVVVQREYVQYAISGHQIEKGPKIYDVVTTDRDFFANMPLKLLFESRKGRIEAVYFAPPAGAMNERCEWVFLPILKLAESAQNCLDVR